MLFCGRELLDRWQLYHQRCLLDICITPYSNAKIAAQTYSVCQFCGENLTHSSGRKESRGGMGQAGGRAGYRGVAQAGLRISTCPNCVKPLPRCAVCLQTMDAANPAAVDPAPHSVRHSVGVGELRTVGSQTSEGLQNQTSQCQFGPAPVRRGPYLFSICFLW